MKLWKPLKQFFLFFKTEYIPTDEEYYQLVEKTLAFLVDRYQFTIHTKEKIPGAYFIFYFKEGVVINIAFEIPLREVILYFYKGTAKEITESGFGYPGFTLNQLLAVRAPQYVLPKPSVRYDMTMMGYLQLCLSKARDAVKQYASDVLEGDFSEIDQEISPSPSIGRRG